MWRNYLIFHLLFVLALMPVAQAIGVSAENGQMPHEMPVSPESSMLDCTEMGTSPCVDLENCISFGHTNCESNTKTSLLGQTSSERPDNRTFIDYFSSQFISHHADLLLRPPRIA